MTSELTPYKYVILSLPRSQSYWIADFLGFDHDASADIASGTYERNSDGLVDTGLYLMPDLFNQLVGPETRIIRMRRSLEEIAKSFEVKFGLTETQSKMLTRYLNHELWDNYRDCPMVFAPLTPERVEEIEDILGLDKHPFMEIREALSIKKDRADDLEYIIKARKYLSQIFNLQP